MQVEEFKERVEEEFKKIDWNRTYYSLRRLKYIVRTNTKTQTIIKYIIACYRAGLKKFTIQTISSFIPNYDPNNLYPVFHNLGDHFVLIRLRRGEGKKPMISMWQLSPIFKKYMGLE